MVLTASMFLFTDFIGDPVLRYDYGYDVLYCVATIIIVNLLIFVYIIVQSIYMAIRKIVKKS